eukprot:1146817-Pelagomonas_calceolata.AAC.1
MAVSSLRGIVLDTRVMRASRLKGLSSSGPNMPAPAAAYDKWIEHSEYSSLLSALATMCICVRKWRSQPILGQLVVLKPLLTTTHKRHLAIVSDPPCHYR